MINSNIALVSPEFVKQNSVIELPVENKALVRSIINCQNIYLQEVLGKDIMDNLIEEYKKKLDDPGYDIPENIIDLLGYVRPYLTAEITRDFIINSSFKMTNKGVNKLTDDNAQTLSSGELNVYKNHVSGIVDTYKKRLIDYLFNKGLKGGTDKNFKYTGQGIYIPGRNKGCDIKPKTSSGDIPPIDFKQVDWEQTDNSKPDYILNKPTFKTINGEEITGIGDIEYNYELPIATDTILGGVKIGDGIDVELDGTISVADPIIKSISTDYTITNDDNNTIIYLTNFKPISITLSSDIIPGFSCILIQEEPGGANIISDGTSIIKSVENSNKLDVRNGSVGILCYKKHVFNITGDLR